MDKTKLIWVDYIIMGSILLAIVVFLVASFTSCTYSITQVHTSGHATDVVDETTTATPTTSVSVPVNLIPR